MEITDCMRALTSFDGYDGYVIGKLVVKQETQAEAPTKMNDENNDASLGQNTNAIIKKQKEDYAVLYSEQWQNDLHRSVTMHLMNPKDIAVDSLVKSAKDENNHSENNVKSITFSQKEVDEFTTLVGDTNSIHHGANAIVPGMLLVRLLLQPVAEHAEVQLSLKFKAPMLVGRELTVFKEDKGSDKWHITVLDKESENTLIEGDMICEKYTL